jgi:aryl-alcohol dehydrogenase-like predicted oxidoreductase
LKHRVALASGGATATRPGTNLATTFVATPRRSYTFSVWRAHESGDRGEAVLREEGGDVPAAGSEREHYNGRMREAKAPAAAAGTIRIGELKVCRFGFGAMRVCGPQVWGPPRDRANALEVLRRAYALGHNFFDTADSYGPHLGEELIAEALRPYPKDLVIATKGGLVRPRPSAWDSDARPEHLRKAVEGSLKRLKRDRIDLYQLHAPDPRVPLEDSLGALADMQEAGKIRHIGVSNVSVEELARSRKIVKVVSVQNEYNLGDRSSEDVLEECERSGIAFLPWFPLGAGSVLKRMLVKKIAQRLGATPSQVALAWLLARSPVMLPIPGTASLAHLAENAAAAKLKLPAEDVAVLSA